MNIQPNFRVKLSDFDFVKMVATFSYFNKNGEPRVIAIHSDTFRKLMTNHPFSDIDQPSSDQSEFRAILKDQLKTDGITDIIAWFRDIINASMKKVTTSAGAEATNV